jgi:tetratricopeptide (TPR) repeat protein
VKLLITSREQLNVSGEWTFEVNGLSYPNFPSGNPPGHLHPIQANSEDRLFEDYSAVALFIQSARRARVGYKIEAEDFPAIAQICRAVDGIPLGIELASTWVRTLTCQEIAREIESSLDFLATSGWGIPERHKSMRAVFDHSWNLLTEEEQSVLGWLSVFRGEFTRQAAKQIAGASLSILSGLIAKSFLRRQSTGRYDMHELLRQYAESKAQTARDRFEAVEGRHSAYYLEIARCLEHPLVGLQMVQARAEFVADIENIRPAWEYAVRHDRVEIIKGSINSFWNFYESHTWYHEAVKTFGLAADEIERTHEEISQMDAAHVILYEYLRCCRGWFLLHVGKFQEARSIIEEGVKTLRSRGALAELSRSLHYLGVIYWQAGEYTKALELFHEKEALDLPGGISWNLGMAYGNLGMVTETMGLFQESRDYLQKAISIFRTVGDIRLLGIGLFYLGSVENRLGMVQEGKAHLYESLEVSRSIGDRFGISMACNSLGLVLQKENSHAEAQRMFQESLDVSREMGEHWIIQQSLVNLGFSKYALGDPAEAQACFLQALRLASETQLIPCILDSLAGIALIYAGQGKAENTLELVMQIQNHPAMTRETKVRVDQLDHEIKNQFSELQREEIYIRAQAKPIERVVEDILATRG